MGGAIGASVNGVLRPCLWMFPLKLIKVLTSQGQCYKNPKYEKKSFKKMKKKLKHAESSCIFNYI